MNYKLKQIISIFLIELIILLPIAIADALNISNVRAEEITDISARIKWETNKPSEGSVNFGNSTNLGQTASSPNFVKEHSILLTSLIEDTGYFFEVTSDDGIDYLVDNNNNNFHTFTTLPKKPLFVNASVSPYYTSKEIDIHGNSIRLAKINMYVNNELPRTLSADNNGNFLFPNINLNEGNNTIRFTAESQSQIIETTYKTIVDTTPPAVAINEIPSMVGSEIITINGKVNELVTISFYVTSREEDTTPPPKVTNLTNTSIEANLVEFSWNEINIDDFGKYIIYRNNIPIAIINNMDYTDYSDAFVNSDQTYTYKITAMDTNGNIGESSNTLTIKTPGGGLTDRPEPEEAGIYEDISGLQETITTENTFTEEIKLDHEDGFYNIKIEAIDTAGNKWLYEKEILLDTKDPEIEIIYPETNAEIFEDYADMVTIRGKTEPGARVYLYVKRTPFAIFNDTWDIYGTPEKLQDIDEADLRADCRIDIDGKEKCKTHADYDTVADAGGYFEFEDVDLTSMWAGAWRITEYPTGEPYYEFVEQERLKDSMDSDLFFVAVDAAGRKGVEQAYYNIVTCWSTDLTWDATPLIEYQSPTFLNVERLKEGTEMIYFYFNFTYHGRGIDSKNTKITHLSVSNACGSGYLENQDRYEYSCKILGKSCTEKLSPNGKTAYVACRLGRLEGIEEWADQDWESFIDAVKNEMTFPFKLTIRYNEEYQNNTIEYQKTHYLCTEVSYVVDAAYINPKEILPDWLLYDFVDFLNKSIDKLNEWIDKLREILEWASIGCMATFFVKFVTQIYRRFTCHYDRFFKKIGGTLQKIGGEKDKQEDECRQCIKEHDPEALEKFDKNKDVQDLISDTCLEKCYPSCAGAWKAEESLYKTYRWTCDRVFGHSSPSKWTETATDTELFQKLSEGSGCANDQSVRGRPLRAVDCIEVEEKYRIRGTFDRDDKCLEITSTTADKKTETLYHIDGPFSEGENVYKISKMDTSAPSLTYDFVIKQNEDNYLAPMEQTCKDICEGKITGQRVQIGLQVQKEKEKIKIKDKGEVKSQKIEGKENEEIIMASGCITPNQCISYTSGEVKQLEIEGKNEFIDVKTAVPMGYTKDCFSPEYVSGDPDQRIECCCINSEQGAIPDYFQPGDIENKDGNFEASGYENMKWSYRYYKMEKEGGYKNKKYNENRYIAERDYMACFGQNHWLYDGFSAAGQGNLLIMDPATDHTTISAFQCVAISQILNRLALIKNIMVALENCLLSIRTTGEADSGVCKEIFTQYICAFIWKIITWIRDGCLPFGKGINLAESENKILEAVGVGTKGIFDSVADSQQELASEYGNAELNNLLGMGEQDVFRKVCLGAFGYDWEIDAESLVDIAYHSPYATLVQAILPSREYLTFDPETYKSKYEYRASWLLNPGCDLDNYEVYLACVTRDDMYEHDDIDCSKQKDPYGRNCDCLDLTEEQAPQPLFYYQSRGKIKQNELQNVDSTQITDRVIDSDYRYDHLMFKLNVDRNYEENKGDISKCFPTGHEDGIFYFPITDYSAREIAGCGIDITTGTFSCSQGAAFFYEEGNAWFKQIELKNTGSVTTNILDPEGATYYAENNDGINAIVKYSKDERKQCLIARLLDSDKKTILANTFRNLRKGELEGQEQTGVMYTITEKDISGEGYGFTIGYVNDDGNIVSGRLTYTPTKKASKEGADTPLIFTDTNGDGAIEISATSTDTYTYKETKQISDCYDKGGCIIKLDNIGAEISVERVYKTPQDNFDFVVDYIETPEQQAKGDIRFYLHLDLRNPKTPNGDCDDVTGIDDYSESQIIVSNGISQQVDIPIYVLPGRTYENECLGHAESPIKEDEECMCEGEKCPDKNDEDKSEDDYTYCYGKCRKYPRCNFNDPLDYECVCDPDASAGKYDCGGDPTGDDAENVPSGTTYCYKTEDEDDATCRNTPPSGISVMQDTTPLEVNLNKPQDGSMYYVGDTINIESTIIDDKVSGEEACEVIIEGKSKQRFVNDQKEEEWTIKYPFKATNDNVGVLHIFIECTDQSMTLNKVSQSKEIGININAK